MAAVLKPGWSKPSTILFASEIPANHKAFAFALAQAREFGSDLILFHAYDTPAATASESSGIRYYDYAAAARPEKQHLEPLAQRVREAGLNCEVVVRPGCPPTKFSPTRASANRARNRSHRDGHALAGSPATPPANCWWVLWLRQCCAPPASPVYIIGPGVPGVVDGSYRNFATRTILCAVSLHEASTVVAAFAAELAAQHGARLILQHVIRPQERAEFLAGRSLDEVEAEMLRMVPTQAAGSGCHPDHRGSRRPDRRAALSEPRAAGRPDRSRRAGRIGFCRHHPARRGLQDPGPRHTARSSRCRL